MADEKLVDPETAEQWALVRTPLGEPWSGRTRYAAAMYFNRRGELSGEALEVYRVCSRLDAEDPLSIIRDRKADEAWLTRMAESEVG